MGNPRIIALVFLGAGLGGVLRYVLGLFCSSKLDPSFPWATLIVNASGCLVMGFLLRAFGTSWPVGGDWRALILVGILGGYTTFSAFAKESFELASEGRWPAAVVYVLATNVLALGGVVVGARLAGLALVRPS